MPSTIERLVTEAVTPGENQASLDILFPLLAVSALLNLFFWVLIDSYHFLVLGILSGILLFLLAKFRSHLEFDKEAKKSTLNQENETVEGKKTQ